jgi:hypothetical protein
MQKNCFRVGGLAQVVACLPSKHEALNSTASTTKNNYFNSSFLNLLWKKKKDRLS